MKRSKHQRKGRGRFGRQWISQPNSAILASVLLHNSASNLPHEALTITAGLAVAEGIDEATGLKTTLHWPNDVTINGAKLAGILLEIRQRGADRDVVIGLGVNALSAPPADIIGKEAICLAEAAAPMPIPEPIEILRSILVRLDYWVQCLQSGKTSALHQQWRNRCDMINRNIKVVSAEKLFTGRVIDVSPLEGLVLLTHQGQYVHLPAAVSTIVD